MEAVWDIARHLHAVAATDFLFPARVDHDKLSAEDVEQLQDFVGVSRQLRRALAPPLRLRGAAMTPDHTKVCFLKTNNTPTSTNVG